MLIVIAGFSANTPAAASTLTCSPQADGVVDKAQGAAFTVKLTFKNTGASNGNWSVAVVFEGNYWSWVGATQNLTLTPGSSKTLTWTGNVPNNATLDSFARLILYYNDSFKSLDWWIHVVAGAELSITSSTVE